MHIRDWLSANVVDYRPYYPAARFRHLVVHGPFSSGQVHLVNLHKIGLSWRWLRPAMDPIVNTSVHGLSRRYDGSHHHECDLLWARSPILERHIRWQIWHSKLLVDGGPDLHRSRLASNSWMRRTLNSSTADLHMKRQPALSIVSVSSSSIGSLQPLHKSRQKTMNVTHGDYSDYSICERREVL